MGSSSKLRFSIEGEEDRISSLPDNILSRILSLLPTKDAVLTSVLSSSWRYQWTQIDSIDIDCRQNVPDRDDLFEFFTFLVNILRKCDSNNILKFRLCFPKAIPLFCLQNCVDFVVSHNVQELELDVLTGLPYELPCEFFSCKSLKVLKIRTDCVFGVPPVDDHTRFPNLKVLHVRFNNPTLGFTDDLFYGCCSQVEELLIEARPNEGFDRCFKILGVSLRKLVIILPVKLKSKFRYKFEMDAPKLEILYLRDDSMSCSFSGIFPHLKHVMFDLLSAGRRDYSAQRDVGARFSEVSNTKFLSLSLDTTTALFRSDYFHLPKLLNLTYLKVTIHDFSVRELLYFLLKACPKLQILILEMVNEGEVDKLRRPLNWPSCAHDRREMPNCLLQELETVRIGSYRGEFVERSVIKYLLECAEVLCSMIVCSIEPSIRDKYSKRLLKLPRSSKHCKLEIL